MNLRLKEIAKKKNLKLDDIAQKMGLSYVALYKRLNNPKASTLQEIATIIDCDIIELILPNDTHQHFYDDKTGEWLGIRKK